MFVAPAPLETSLLVPCRMQSKTTIKAISALETSVFPLLSCNQQELCQEAVVVLQGCGWKEGSSTQSLTELVQRMTAFMLGLGFHLEKCSVNSVLGDEVPIKHECAKIFGFFIQS